MPTVTFQPSGQTLTVPTGLSLLDTCHRAGVGVPAACGGKGLCGKCRVRVVQGKTAVDTGHLQALSPAEVEAGWRLACLIRVNEDLIVETGDGAPVRSVILTDFSGREAETDDAVQAIGLKLPPPLS